MKERSTVKVIHFPIKMDATSVFAPKVGELAVP